MAIVVAEVAHNTPDCQDTCVHDTDPSVPHIVLWPDELLGQTQGSPASDVDCDGRQSLFCIHSILSKDHNQLTLHQLVQCHNQQLTLLNQTRNHLTVATTCPTQQGGGGLSTSCPTQQGGRGLGVSQTGDPHHSYNPMNTGS